jgi:hypothetical protein
MIHALGKKSNKNAKSVQDTLFIEKSPDLSILGT